MVTVVEHRTAELDDAVLARIRALMDAAFDDFTDLDWAHALGGTHALVVEEGADGEVLAHASVVPRRLRVGEADLWCGYVEAVAVRPDRQGTGLGAAVMATIERLAAEHDLLALSASEAAAGFYLVRGWQLWRGPSYVETPEGPDATPDEDGAIYVWRPEDAGLDLDGPIMCDWREGDVW